MKRFFLLLLFFAVASPAFAAATYGSGTYTNICGTGTAATSNECKKGCDIGSGSCTSSGNNVVKFTCDGRLSECKNNESGFASSQSLAGTACGKTVQIDVFTKNCRNGGWTCGTGDMMDYMVWYSGDCQTVPACDSNQLTMNVNPNPVSVNNSITFSAAGSQGSTWIGDTWSGGVNCAGTVWGDKSCTANAAGSYTWTHTWRNCAGNFDNCGSTCSKQVNYRINATAPTPAPTPTPTFVPTATSSCDSLSVVSGNHSFVPATVTLRARGSDSAGSIQRYRFYFGDGKTEEATNAEIQHRYESSGSFTARADVLDSRGNWKSSSACETGVNVTSLPLESQKSDCSDLFITGGNYSQPPTTGKFLVTGYDNKGSLRKYKVDFGNGVVKESDSNAFEQVYDRTGTYTVSGFIKDTQNNWKGGSGSCQKALYVSTQPLTSQPATGTPTALTVIAILGGASGFAFMIAKQLRGGAK